MSVAAAIATESLPSRREPVAPPRCLYCGHDEFAPLHRGVRDRLGHVPGEWSFVRCLDCGSANLRPFPRAEDLAAFYPPVYTFSPELAQSALKRIVSALEYRLFFQPIYGVQTRIVDGQVRPRGARPGKLLDIGCGRGLRLVEFRQRGYDVQGMDFVPDSVEYVQRTLGIPAICTDVAGLKTQYEPESFDVVTAFYVLEHVTDLEATLAACLQLLKPGGWLAAAVPLADSIQAHWFGKRWSQVTEAPRHISLPSQAGLRRAAVQAGFARETVVIRPEAAMQCSATAALSLLPAGNSTQVYGRRRWLAVGTRIGGALLTLGQTPWIWLENRLWAKPAAGILFAQKPPRRNDP